MQSDVNVHTKIPNFRCGKMRACHNVYNILQIPNFGCCLMGAYERNVPALTKTKFAFNLVQQQYSNTRRLA